MFGIYGLHISLIPLTIMLHIISLLLTPVIDLSTTIWGFTSPNSWHFRCPQNVREDIEQMKNIINKIVTSVPFNVAIIMCSVLSFAFIIIFLPRLTELSVDCIIESEVENVDTFIYSTPLKSLDIFRKSNRDNESFLMQLLQSNSNLEHFKLRTYDKLVLTKSFIEKLMSSNLKSCYLDVLGMISVQDPDSFSSHVLAEHRPAAFPSLTVSIYNTPPAYQEEAMVAFLQCCPNVHYLRFCYISPNILQSLFKHQVIILFLSSFHYSIGISL